MNRIFFIRLIGSIVFVCCAGNGLAQEDLSKYVDPFIGVDGGGNIFPGPCVPFGMVKVGPDCGKKDWNAGWDSDGNIHGFSNVHVSGAGGGAKYGNVLLAPIVGEINPDDYSSPRQDERGALGLYEVNLSRYLTSVRLTALKRSAMHEYTFPASNESKILIDAGSFLASHELQYLVGSEVRILSNHEIEGYTRIRGGWNIGSAYTVYFYALFDTPAASCGSWKEQKVVPNEKAQYDTNQKTGAYFNYHTGERQKITVKIGISYLSVGKAKANLLAEMTSWNFDEIRTECVKQWNTILNKVQLKGSEEQKKIFYTALYHSFLQPVDKTGENSKWVSEEPYYDDYNCIWDTFRATHPLITLLAPSVQTDMLRSLLDIYVHTGYMPDARSGDDNGRVQGGTNCDIMMADAYVKGLKGIDYKLALKAMIHNAEISPGGDERKEGRGGILDYNTKGYVSTKYERAGSRTMEYANCDYAVATVAQGLQENAVREKYLKRSENWQNLWNPEIESLGFKGFVWPRREDGSWWAKNEYSVFKDGTWHDFLYETFPWEISFYVPHNIKALIEKCGGKEVFVRRLNTYFTHELWDQSLFMGLFQVSNEPGFLTPCLYNYAGRPDRTAEVVRRILRERYHATRDGIPGNDDSGSMSSWYVFHSLGFYPNAGQDLYLISSPTFEEAVIRLENGKTLQIKTKNAGEKNIYIQSAKWNGIPFERNYLKHTDIAEGGTLEFVMGSKPSQWGKNFSFETFQTNGTYNDGYVTYAPNSLTEEEKQITQVFVGGYDNQYDAEGKMLLLKLLGWSFHRDAESGGAMHEVRESLYYANALFCLNDPQYLQRALDIVEKVISLQDTNPVSASCGVWPYYEEEPLSTKKSPVDYNWADFNAVTLLDIYMGHKDKIPSALLRKMEDAIRLAAYSIQKRNCGPEYTNIAIMGTYVTYLVSHLFELSEMKTYAKKRLQRFFEHTLSKNGFSEYNSPTYTIVALDELARMKEHIVEPDAKAIIDSLYVIAWETIARHYHLPSAQWAGPHSRAYATLASPSFYGILYQASGGKIDLGYRLDRISRHRIPAHLLSYFIDPRYPRTEKIVFENTKPEIIGTTYLTENYVLSSANRSCLWDQRRPFLAYWGSIREPSYLKLRLLHDFHDLSAATFFGEQKDNTILAAINFATDGGDRHLMDILKDGRFKAKDLRLRFEFGGRAANGDLSLPVENDASATFKMDDIRFDLRLFCAVFGEYKGHWEKGRDSSHAWLDYVIYAGEETEIDLTKIDMATLGFIFSMAAGKEHIPQEAVSFAVKNGMLDAQWNGMSIRVPVKPNRRAAHI